MTTKTVSTLWSEPANIDNALFRYSKDSTLAKSVSSSSSTSVSGESSQSTGIHVTAPSSLSSSSTVVVSSSSLSSSSSSSTNQPHSIPNPTVSLKYAQYSYDNISFPDVMARTEYGMNLLDTVIEMVKNNIQSEEMYAKALNDSAVIANNGRSKGTGQGIAVTVDGVPVKQASMIGAGLQAIGLGGFFGSSSSSTASASSSASSNSSSRGGNNASNNGTIDNYNPFGGNNGPNSSQSSANGNLSITVGNGPSTIINALEQFSRAQFKASHQRQMIAAHLRKIINNLFLLKDNQSKLIGQLFARANEIIRNTQTIARDLERAQQRVDKARKDLQYAEQYLLSAKSSGIEIDRREVQNRQARVANAMGELETAEGQIILISEALVTGRRKRDDDFTVIARQLQKLDEERNTLLARTLNDLASTSSETGSATRFLASSLLEASSTVGVESDIRMFTHQRRIAHMIIEQSALADVRGSNRNLGTNGSTGMGLGKGDEEAAVVPQPLPVTISMRHHRDFIHAEKQLSPIIVRWINAILLNKGYEILNGQRVPIVGTCSSSDEKDKNGTVSETMKPSYSSEDDDEDEGFDIDMLDHHAARIALLRTLNQQRSKKQDVSVSFYRLARVLWWLLDACEVHEDICCARMVTVMAETFFHDPVALENKRCTTDSSTTKNITLINTESTSNDNETNETKPSSLSSSPSSSRHSTTKVFLQTILKRHNIWRSESFWEEIFFQSVYNAVRISSSPYNGSSNGTLQRSSSNASDYNSSVINETPNGNDETPVSPTGSEPPPPESPSSSTMAIATVPAARPGTTDWNYGYTQTIFSQLAAVAMNMITFGMPPDRVLRTVTSLARGNGLPNEMIHILLDTVKTYESQEK